MNVNNSLPYAIALAVVGCASQLSAEDHQSRAGHYHERVAENREEGDRPPKIGMSKDEVLNQYGQPVNVSISSRGGEVWVYVFNNFDARVLIPYYGEIHEAFRKRNSGTIIFGPNGRVADYHWNMSNPVGGTVFR
jgi:outer membrane protein assembly factor BamE (lipoprotein component of BamABCDE complex)